MRGKLRRAFGVTEPAREEPPSRDALRRHFQRRARTLPEVELPEGSELHNERGVCYLRRVELPVGTAHGAVRLERPAPESWARLAELAKVDELAWNPEECLFLDTETTGLSGGAGTVVFMCGLGFFEGDRLVIEQVFLRAFGEEPAAMQHVARRMAEHPALVSFVGKSFDRHRLKARMTLHKIVAPVLTDRHLDLYYLARRAHGKDLPNVRLQTVEERLLGLFRHGDLPGAEAPYAFLRWLRDRSGAVDQVFEHNYLDVLSLVALLNVLGRSSPVSPDLD